MKKIGKKIAAMLCMLSTAVPGNTQAKDSGNYSISKCTISSSNKKYEQMFKKATSNEYLKFLSGYTTKKNKNNPEKEFVTGKIEFVPIGKEHYKDWMRIFDCLHDESRKYLKYWVHNKLSLSNDSMQKDFKDIISNSCASNPNSANFMIRFYELYETSKTEEEIKNNETKIKFKEPKIVGHIYLNLLEENNLMSGYVIDKDFQGKGIATKALSLITKLSLKLYKDGFSPGKSIVMYIVDNNKGSNRVAEKCGFVDMGRIHGVSCVDPKKNKVHKWVKKLTTDSDSDSKIKYAGYVGLGIAGGAGIIGGVALLEKAIKKIQLKQKNIKSLN